MKIKAVIWQEDGVWCGSVPCLPGCHTWGDSYEHLLEMLQDAILGWLEVASQREDHPDLGSSIQIFMLSIEESLFAVLQTIDRLGYLRVQDRENPLKSQKH
ncbi:type II toxin-antitoxin system HicB family antitoxin [Nostoc flagelliforme]|uniref:type II toxin-antitoxin system HicB family antitoxin n=1 Tax=Nostoc flagelliforme TaxID=1306274 RepID=UPI00269E98EA